MSVPLSAKAMWLAQWPGVVIASSAQPSPSTTSPSASTRSGRKSMSPRRIRAARASPMLSGRAARCGPSPSVGAPVAALMPRRRRRMVAMGVGDEDMRHRLAAHGVEQRRDMRVVQRARIDDGDAAAADDVAHRSLEGERPRIVAQDPPDAGRDLLDLAGRQVERLVEGDVVAHAASTCAFGRPRSITSDRRLIPA